MRASISFFEIGALPILVFTFKGHIFRFKDITSITSTPHIFPLLKSVTVSYTDIFDWWGEIVSFSLGVIMCACIKV